MSLIHQLPINFVRTPYKFARFISIAQDVKNILATQIILVDIFKNSIEKENKKVQHVNLIKMRSLPRGFLSKEDEGKNRFNINFLN